MGPLLILWPERKREDTGPDPSHRPSHPQRARRAGVDPRGYVYQQSCGRNAHAPSGTSSKRPACRSSDGLTSRPFIPFCVRLLRRYGEPLADLRPGFTPRFTIFDEADQVAAIKSVYRDVGLDEKFMKARSLLSIVSHAKNHGQTIRDAIGSRDEMIAVVFEKYQALLKASNAFDFDDLLLESVRLLRHSDPTPRRVARTLSLSLDRRVSGHQAGPNTS